MTQTPEKVIQINTDANILASIQECDNYIIIGTKDDGMNLTYAYDIKEDISWLEMALFLGYMEMIKNRIQCTGGCE